MGKGAYPSPQAIVPPYSYVLIASLYPLCSVDVDYFPIPLMIVSIDLKSGCA